MKQRAAFSLSKKMSKKIAFCVATLCSGTAFAACPEVSEIYLNQAGQWITDSGWVSTSSGTDGLLKPGAFSVAYIANPKEKSYKDFGTGITKTTYSGNMVCAYKTGTEPSPLPPSHAPIVDLSMEHPHNIATTKPLLFSWEKITGGPRSVLPFSAEGVPYAICTPQFFNNNCQFDSAAVIPGLENCPLASTMQIVDGALITSAKGWMGKFTVPESDVNKYFALSYLVAIHLVHDKYVTCQYGPPENWADPRMTPPSYSFTKDAQSLKIEPGLFKVKTYEEARNSVWKMDPVLNVYACDYPRFGHPTCQFIVSE